MGSKLYGLGSGPEKKKTPQVAKQLEKHTVPIGDLEMEKQGVRLKEQSKKGSSKEIFEKN